MTKFQENTQTDGRTDERTKGWMEGQRDPIS